MQKQYNIFIIETNTRIQQLSQPFKQQIKRTAN
jgi:hypothetical protein